MGINWLRINFIISWAFDYALQSAAVLAGIGLADYLGIGVDMSLCWSLDGPWHLLRLGLLWLNKVECQLDSNEI